MSGGSHSESAGKVTVRTLIPPVLVAIMSILIVLVLRLAPNWDTEFRASFVMMALTIILLVVFYASVLASLASLREMKGTISGWFDVICLIIIEGVLAYLVLADALYIAIVILLSCAFVVYLNFAQSD